MEEPTSLVLREECCQDSVIVALAGELDTVSERHLTGLITRLLEKESRRVLFDLSGVQFLDTAGIRGPSAPSGASSSLAAPSASSASPRSSRTSSPSPGCKTTSSCTTQWRRRWPSH
jgi:hypothetical protein